MLENLFPNLNFHYFGPIKPKEFDPEKSVIVNSFTQSDGDVEWISKQLENPYQRVFIYLKSSETEDQNQVLSKPLETLLKNENLYVITDDLKRYQTIIKNRFPRHLCYSNTFLNPESLLYLPKRVILLTRDTERVTHVNTYLLNSLSNIKITEAIDAKTPGALDAYLENNKILVTQAIKAGMVGCFCSHHKLWKELLFDTEDPYYLVLEDDVIPHDSMVKDLKHILSEVPFTFDILFIYFNYPSSSEKTNQDSFQYIEKVTPEISEKVEPTMCAYIISKKCAYKLITDFKNIENQLADMVYKEISQNNLEAYYSKKLIFTNIGVKETPKLSSNTQSSIDYSKYSKSKFKFW